ncbi:unnamed protein product, partial [Effrenium voratum]
MCCGTYSTHLWAAAGFVTEGAALWAEPGDAEDQRGLQQPGGSGPAAGPGGAAVPRRGVFGTRRGAGGPQHLAGRGAAGQGGLSAPKARAQRPGGPSLRGRCECGCGHGGRRATAPGAHAHAPGGQGGRADRGVQALRLHLRRRGSLPRCCAGRGLRQARGGGVLAQRHHAGSGGQGLGSARGPRPHAALPQLRGLRGDPGRRALRRQSGGGLLVGPHLLHRPALPGRGASRADARSLAALHVDVAGSERRSCCFRRGRVGRGGSGERGSVKGAGAGAYAEAGAITGAVQQFGGPGAWALGRALHHATGEGGGPERRGLGSGGPGAGLLPALRPQRRQPRRLAGH